MPVTVNNNSDIAQDSDAPEIAGELTVRNRINAGILFPFCVIYTLYKYYFIHIQ